MIGTQMMVFFAKKKRRKEGRKGGRKKRKMQGRKGLEFKATKLYTATFSNKYWTLTKIIYHITAEIISSLYSFL